jgi:Kef-type K+ transport system membrane component KefB
VITRTGPSDGKYGFGGARTWKKAPGRINSIQPMKELFEHFIHEFELPLRNAVLIFSLILFIILLSPILLRKLNIPGIIGLIISGVIIGPHGLGILENDSAIGLFSTIGLLYIMFIAGLELDLNEFRLYRNKSLVFGLLTFAVPLAIGFPVCFHFLGYDFNASLLTASMFATHTLVAYPIVSKLGISKNQAVAVAVGGTILTDTAVLIILAVIMGNSQGSLSGEFWVRLGVSLAVFSAIMFIVIPRIAKWFFRKLESEKHSHYIFVLSVVFFAAFLAEAAGVEAIIGAFVAGLALNKLIPHSSALMNRIEFIGNSLFIPFFLISVGMLVDVSVLMNGPAALIVAVTLSVVALLGKWIAALGTQLIFRYSRAQRQLIFGLSSAHAAATLAVILVGYKAGILDENILNGTILLILITCIVASFATERASKRILVEGAEDSAALMRQDEVANEHILLPIGRPEQIERLLEFSLLIKDRKSVNPVSILSVVSNNEESELNIVKSKSKLETFVRQASASDSKVNIITTIDHNVASGISRISREIMADAVVLGWPERVGILDKFIGDKVENILAGTDKSVYICHLTKPMVSHKRIVIAVPPLAERENGFNQWLAKLTKLAQELSLPMLICCNAQTERAIHDSLRKSRIAVGLTFEPFSAWEDFLILARTVREDDLFVLISARKGSASYLGLLELLPSKLERHFEANNRIVVYPQLFAQDYWGEGYEDVSAEPLSRGIETIQKIGKGIGSIFRKEEGA